MIDSLENLRLIPKDLQWTVANSAFLQNIYILKQPPSYDYGPRAKLIRWLLGVFRCAPCLLLIMRVIALVDVMRWWWRAGCPSQMLPVSCRIFVGFGAGQEEQMWQQFVNEGSATSIRLDQVRAATFGQFYRPSLWALWAGVWCYSREVMDFLSNATGEPVSSYRMDFAAFATTRLAQYVFFLCWWKGGPTEQIEQVVFISPDTPGFACLDAGVSQVEFRQHGLLRKSVLMPQFQSLRLLTDSEAAYYQAYMPNARIVVEAHKRKVEVPEKIMIVASVYDFPGLRKADSGREITDILAWAANVGVRVIVRKHPRESDEFWESNFPNVEVDRSDSSFEEALLQIRPMMVITWFSTALVDAYMAGVVPVTICTKTDSHVQDLIVNLNDYCFSWNSDRDVLDKLAAKTISVEECIGQLKHGSSII